MSGFVLQSRLQLSVLNGQCCVDMNKDGKMFKSKNEFSGAICTLRKTVCLYVSKLEGKSKCGRERERERESERVR